MDALSYPFRRPDPLAPPPEYARLRADRPVTRVTLFDGSTAWLVTSYELAREVYRDTRFSSNPRKPGFPLFSPGSSVVKQQDTSLLRMDPPEHREHRRMLVPGFTVRRSATYLPLIREAVTQTIDDILAGPKPRDFVQAFALPIPSIVICALLGVPYADHEEFHLHSRVRVSQTSTAEDVAAANVALMAMLDRLVTAKEADPGDDLISRLSTREGLSHDDLVMMALLMLFAGHETTANMLSLSVLTLLHNPDQLADLRANPHLVADAVEELMRFLSIAHVSPARAATEDLWIGDQLVRAGEGVIAPLMAANWDADVFPEPQLFNIRRDEIRNHVGFGHGVHQCIGQTLARLELRVALTELAARIPTLALGAPIEDLPFKHDALFYGLYELPVTW